MKNKALKLCSVLVALAAIIAALSGCSMAGSNKFADDNWDYEMGAGAVNLAVEAGGGIKGAPKMLRDQIEGEWIIHTDLQYNDANPNGKNHAGIVLWVDHNNYIIWGQYAVMELQASGEVRGKDLGTIASLDSDYHYLRIMKNTRDSEYTRYYFYGANDSYYSWQYAGYYEDKAGVFDDAKYGLIGVDYESDASSTFCVRYEFFDEYTVYNIKDWFTSDKLDGRWECSESLNTDSLATGSWKLNFAASEDSSYILREPLPYDWTLEAQLLSPEANDTTAGLIVRAESGSTLTIGAKGNEYIAAVNGNEIGSVPLEAGQFVKIIKDKNSYSLRISEKGESWITVADYTDTNGEFEDIKYGLFAQGSGKGSFGWFNERPTPNGIIKDVEYFDEICLITGENSLNKTQSRWGWGSGDLGSMCELNGKVYMFFGDTFEGNNQYGDWYHNSMAVISDLDNFQNGLIFDDMKVNLANYGMVRPRAQSDDQSMIATSCFATEHNGVETLYMHIMTIRKWTSNHRHWTVNGSGWATSTDGGNSWTLHDFTFEGETNFAQIACAQIGDELYILGAPAARYGTVKLCKVHIDEILNKDAYKFFIGTDESGEPMWSESEYDAVTVIDSVNGEIGLFYNEGLDCYMFTTLDNVSQQMVIRDAKELWGEWSMPVLLFDESYIEYENSSIRYFYGSFSHPRFMEDGGKTVYMTLNKTVPYNISWMKVHFEINEDK